MSLLTTVLDLREENARLTRELKWEREMRIRLAPDKCSICHGSKGGVPGNENIVDGVVMCDYCHAERMRDGRRS